MEVDNLNTSVINFFTDEERATLTPCIYQKINSEFKIKIDRISSLEQEIERDTTDYDQLKFEHERSLVDLRNELEETQNIKNTLETNLNSVKEDLSDKEESLKTANDKVSTLLRQVEQFRSEHEEAAAKSVSLAATVEAKSKMVDMLQEQKAHLEEQLAESQKSKFEALLMSEEANVSQLQIQFKQQHFEKEKEYYTRQMGVLQRQLGERSTELITLRYEHSKSLVALQADLNHALEESRTFQEENKSFKTEVQEKNKRINDLIKSLAKSQESEVTLENSYRKEIIAQENMTNKYKGSLEDQCKLNQEQEKAIGELKRLLQEASEHYGALEKAKIRMQEDAQKSLNQRDLLVKELKEELENVNELLKLSHKKEDDIIADLSPSASAACQLMSKGLTLSQLYNEYLATSQKLFKSEDENKRISRYLDQILKEIEEKAPILNKQREDYEKALDTINTLHMQIDNSIEELEQQRLESDEAKRRSNYLGRENASQSQQVKDLSKQVTILLTQVEAARSGMPPPPLSVLENVDATNANDVIDQNLLMFRNVNELQDQNLKLLTSIRDLSEQMETAEKSAVESKTQDLIDELETAKKELDELRMSRDRLKSSVENISKQRDCFRAMVNQQSPNKMSQNTSGMMVSESEFQEVESLKKELEKTEKEINKLKKEHEDYRQEKSKNDQMEKSEWDRMKSMYDKTKMENVKLLSQAEYNEERFKTLQKNCEAYQRQVNGLTEKNDTLRGIVGRHESTIDSLRESTLKLTKDLSHLEMVTANLREERTMLKENEARILVERESLHGNQYSQSMMVSNLEAIKNNLEKKDSETKMVYENQIADLIKQSCSLKAKLESNHDLKEAQLKITYLEKEIESTSKELEKTKQNLQKAESEISRLNSESLVRDRSPVGLGSPGAHHPHITSPRQQQYSPRFGVRGQRASSPMLIGPNPNLPHTVRELQIQLSEEKARSQSLQNMAKEAQDHVSKLRAIVENQEKQLKEDSECTKAAEEEIKKLRQSFEEADKSVKVLQQKLSEAAERETALKESSDKQLLSITEDLEGRENELEEAQKKLEEIKQLEDRAKIELRHQAQIASEMQNKYEREVMLHGADLRAMSEIKEKLATHNDQLDAATAAKLKAEESATTLKEGLEEREALMKRTVEDLKVRNDELEEQNKKLLEQFTQLSDKMGAIQTKLASSGDGANTSFSEEDARTSDQLREIIKYLRRERELALGKLEVSEAESVRLDAQKKSLESKVDHLNQCLTDEREKSQAGIESAGKYAELMRKVHTMDALSDSNRLLRNEKDDLKTELDQAKTKMNSIQNQIEPLQESLQYTKNKLESVMTEKKSIEDEKESYKKRTQELVQKLNRARPEDMIKLQQEVNGLQKDVQGKDSEINKLKAIHNNLQKIHQAAMTHKNHLMQQLQAVREESKKMMEESKKHTEEKALLQQQNTTSIEKIRSLEETAQQSSRTQQQEQQRSREQKNQVIQQLIDVRQKEEASRKEIDSLKKALEAKEGALKERETNLVASASKIEGLMKQANQLRRIANKYKMKAESTAEAGEGTSFGAATAEEEAEDKKDQKCLEGFVKKEEFEKITEQNEMLKKYLEEKEEEINNLKSEDGDGEISRLQSDLKLKAQELQKLSQMHSDYKLKLHSQLEDINKSLDESQRKKLVYESLINKLEKEKEQFQQQIETLNKKLSMQQKMIENMQKQQTASGSKASPNVITIEKPSTDPPPTANIKPMAVPPTPPTISSPRSQAASQPGSGSRAIPTASIRPMAPTPVSSGQPSSVVVVNPLETHNSGDGAVSSTVTLPQATVTPTPVAPASTTTQAFPPSLTATVSPTLVSHIPIASSASFSAPQVVSVPMRQDESMDTVGPTPSGSADNIISQVIAMVAPNLEDRPMGSKRKLEVVEEEQEDEDDESKRLRIQEEVDEEDSLEREEDVGEPSSSSNTNQRNVESEVFDVSSDDDEDAPLPPSQSGHEEGDNSDNSPQEEGGREAEAEERIEEGQVPSAIPSSSSAAQSIPPRPSNEHPSSSRQSLPQFHPLPQYEESVDDRIVPSTPTLVVPRPLEGSSQGDGVSSQVPSQGFEFSASHAAEVAPSNDGLAQMAEGGIVDVSRMDLDQLEEGASRGAGVSTLSRSPTDLSTEGNISSSGGDGSSEVSQQHAEPDSVVQMRLARPDSDDAAEAAEPESRDDEMVSSLGHSRDDQEEEANDDEDDEDSPEDVPVDYIEDDDSDNGEIEEEDSSQRATRSTRSRGGRVRRGSRGSITPISWQGPEGACYVRPFTRGPRAARGGAAPAPSQPRVLTPRGNTQRGRRSRPLYFPRGSGSQM